MSDQQSDTDHASQDQPSSSSGNRVDRRGPLNRALILEKKSARTESSTERDLKITMANILTARVAMTLYL